MIRAPRYAADLALAVAVVGLLGLSTLLSPDPWADWS
jgi:hypothetical protein